MSDTGYCYTGDVSELRDKVYSPTALGVRVGAKLRDEKGRLVHVIAISDSQTLCDGKVVTFKRWSKPKQRWEYTAEALTIVQIVYSEG